MRSFGGELLRTVKKIDKKRVALRKTACGAALIDGLSFTASVESDGAASDKGITFSLSGNAVNEGRLIISEVFASYPCGSGTVRKKVKPEKYRTNAGKLIYRIRFPDAVIYDGSDAGFPTRMTTEEELAALTQRQMIFRFTPEYQGYPDDEVLLNIYPSANPLDGSVSEWITVTGDKEFFEHGGIKKIKKK